MPSAPVQTSGDPSGRHDHAILCARNHPVRMLLTEPTVVRIETCVNETQGDRIRGEVPIPPPRRRRYAVTDSVDDANEASADRRCGNVDSAARRKRHPRRKSEQLEGEDHATPECKPTKDDARFHDGGPHERDERNARSSEPDDGADSKKRRPSA